MNEDDQPHRITEKGMALAVQVLARDGYLDDMEPTESFVENFIKLKAACNKYRDASVAKGGERSDEECRDAIMIAYFEAYLTDVVSHFN